MYKAIDGHVDIQLNIIDKKSKKVIIHKDISKIFKEETGEAPINYLIKMRLERARIQLESDNGQSIKAISNSVGYDDVYYFSKLFKKYYGMSPVHYRSKYKKVV